METAWLFKTRYSQLNPSSVSTVSHKTHMQYKGRLIAWANPQKLTECFVRWFRRYELYAVETYQSDTAVVTGLAEAQLSRLSRLTSKGSVLLSQKQVFVFTSAYVVIPSFFRKEKYKVSLRLKMNKDQWKVEESSSQPSLVKPLGPFRRTRAYLQQQST
jgi:hypothetical protein